MPKIGNINASLTLESASFINGMKKSAAATKENTTALQGLSARMSAIKTGAVAMLAAIGGRELLEAAKRSLEYASSLDETAQQLGVTAEQLQVYRYAGTQVGITQEAMDKSLAKLTKTIGEAVTGGQQQAEVFKALGISLKESNGAVITAGDSIPKIADALEKIPDPAVRARIETALFGKAGQQLDTLLSGGSKAIDQLRTAAEDLGIVLNEDQIQNADRTADKLAELETVLKSNIAGAVANNAKAIYDFVNALEQLISAIPRVLRKMDEFDQRFNILKAQKDRMYYPMVDPTENERFLRDNQRGLARNEFLDKLDAASPEARRAAIAKMKPSTRAYFGLGGAAPATGTDVDRNIPQLGGGSHGGKGDTDREAEKRAKAERKFNDDMDRMHAEELDTEADINDSAASRYKATIARLDADNAAFDRETNDNKELTDTQKQQLIAEHDKLTEQKKFLAMQRQQNEVAEEAYQRAKDDLDAKKDELEGQLALATTIKERRKLELEILENRKQAEKAELERTLATAPTGSEAYTTADRGMKTLDARYGLLQQGVINNNLMPWEAFLKDLHTTATGMDEEFQKMAVSGVQAFNDQLVDAILNGKSLGDVFSAVAKQILADLLKIELQAAESKLFGGSAGGGGGGFFASLGKLFGLGGGSGALAGNLGADWGGAGSAFSPSSASDLLSSMPSFAMGGDMTILGRPGIDRNVLSLNGRQIANVSYGEKLSVGRGDKSSAGRPIIFDARGAVMTADLLQQMQVIAVASGGMVVGENNRLLGRKAAQRL